MMRKYILICTLVFVCAKIKAQEYYFEHYTTDNGLASNNVFKVYQDAKGYIWFATNKGVCRHEGKTFQNFSVKDGLTDNSVFNFDEDDAGRIYFLTFSGRICYFDDGQFHETRGGDIIRQHLKKNVACSLAAFSPDSVFLGLRAHGSITVSKDTVRVDDHPQGSFFIREFENGKIICGTNGLGIRYQETYKLCLINGSEKKEFIGRSSGFLYPRAVRLNDSQFVFSCGCRLMLLDTDGTLREIVDYGHHIIEIKKDNDGNLWVGTLKNGAYCYHSSDIFSPPVVHLLDGYSVNLLQDNEGNYWFATLENGVYKMYSNNLKCYSVLSLEEGERIKRFFPIGDDLYMATNRAKLFVLNNGKIRPSAPLKEKFPDLVVYSYMRTSDGKNILAGVWKDTPLFDRFIIQTKGNITSTALNAAFKRMLESKKDSTVLIATRSGLFEIQDDSLFHFEESFDFRIENFVEDNEGNLLLMNLDGIWRLSYEDRKNHRFKVEKSELSDTLKNSFEFIYTEDRILCATTLGSGLFLITPDEIIQYDRKHTGYPTDFIYAVCEDSNGGFWFVAEGGIFKLSKRENNETGFSLTRVFNIELKDVTDLFFEDNKLFIASSHGLFVFDDLNKQDSHEPKLDFSGIYINHKKQPVKNSYVLEYNENNIELQFQAISFRNVRNREYFYQLKGVDEDWIRLKENIIRFPQLSPGNYTVLISVSGKKEPLSVHFQIKPPVWKKWWFLLLCFVLLAALLWGISFQRYRSLLKKMRMREKVLEAEDNLLKAQINPHFIFNSLNTLNSFIYKGARDKAIAHVNTLSELLRYMLSNKDTKLATLAEEYIIVKKYCYLQRARYQNALEFDLQINEAEAKEFLIIPLAFQMLVENAVKHNYATSGKVLTVRAYVENRYLVVCNNLQKRKAIHSSKIGLANINRRYRYVSNQPVVVSQTKTEFIVKLPLIKDISRTK